LSGLLAQLANYNQQLFYVLMFFSLAVMFSFSFNDSIGKLHLYQVLTRPDMCGYRRILKSNESVVYVFNMVLFFVFFTLVGFYVARDDYLGTIIAESVTSL